MHYHYTQSPSPILPCALALAPYSISKMWVCLTASYPLSLILLFHLFMIWVLHIREIIIFNFLCHFI